ncbi:hypothetical protein G6F61_014270 [Rhizopus arrhizus]|nr:hypothetical protein G6F61_014270 [Rhizopus arrhizus]
MADAVVAQLETVQVEDQHGEHRAALAPGQRQRILQAVEQAARQFAPLILEFRLRAEGTDARWVRSQAHPYAAEAGAVTWSGYWVDVSEARAQADALVAAKAAAEQAAEAKSLACSACWKCWRIHRWTPSSSAFWA